MIFHHPPAKRYRLRPEENSPMQTVVLHLSPYGVGRLGGEMARRMMDAARNYLEEVTTQEIRNSFRKEVRESIESRNDHKMAKNTYKMPNPIFFNHSGDEAHANQYPSGNDSH